MVLLPFPFSWIRNYRKKIGWRRVWAYFFFGRFIKLEILEILEDICDFIFFFLNIVEMISSWVHYRNFLFLFSIVNNIQFLLESLYEKANAIDKIGNGKEKYWNIDRETSFI